MMTMQPSLTILKIETFLACEQDLQLKGYREKSCASGTGEQGARKNRESSSFLHKTLSLTHEFACHSKMDRLLPVHKLF